MPTYEYRCKTCGKEFEYMQKITEEPLTNCPEKICEGKIKGMGHVERKISKNIGLVFNGSGFYLTDYVHKHTSGSSSNGNGNSKVSSATKSETVEKSCTKCENCVSEN